jgi:hypothetical protein
MATATPITDHDEIQRWVEKRGGRPARVSATGGKKDPGILRIDFPGYSGEDTLEEIDWDTFFEWFDRNKLAILLTDQRGSRFSKFVSRSTARGSKRASAKKAGGAKKAAAKRSSAKKAGGTKKAASKKGGAKKAASARYGAASKKTSSKKKPRRKWSAKKDGGVN